MTGTFRVTVRHVNHQTIGGDDDDVGVWCQGLLTELVSNCDGQLKAEVTQTAAFYEHRLQTGQKAIYHLEAFIAKFMALYKRFLEEGVLLDAFGDAF